MTNNNKRMNMNYIKTLILFASVLILSGCADSMSFQQASEATQVGFFYGFWHGVIAPLAFIISLFDEDVAVYAIYNNSAWYDLGYILGIGGFAKACDEGVQSK